MALIECDSFVPHLCGGIFLSLLDVSKKSTSVIRKQIGHHQGSGITSADILADLVAVITDTYDWNEMMQRLEAQEQQLSEAINNSTNMHSQMESLRK